MLIVWQPARRLKISKNGKNMGVGSRRKRNPYIPICRTLFHLTHTLLAAQDTPLRATIWLVIGYDCHGPNNNPNCVSERLRTTSCIPCGSCNKVQSSLTRVLVESSAESWDDASSALDVSLPNYVFHFLGYTG